MSKEYEMALAKHNEAIHAFDVVTKAYRTRQIGDAEYLEGRKNMAIANAIFDAAFEAEANRVAEQGE